MTLPGFLNPWAEVQKWCNSAYYLGKAVESLMIENADLRRRIAEMEKA
ncbi:hypothetical protein MKW11_14820 [Gluconobacter frateurii]|nr:hypothetical protein [Gluconobacter frateurii]UMM08439.1 hypothetical protein MKW11_14820 [Gluconobacter frateurii]